MQLSESLAIALHSLLANKLRSGLAMLGIVIGVASVVGMLSIGQGAQEAIAGEIDRLGPNVLFVLSGAADITQSVRQAMGTSQTLSYDDALALARPGACPSVVRVAPEVLRMVQVVYEAVSTRTWVHAVTPEFTVVRNYRIARGQGIDSGHLASSSRVAVLGARVAENLFGSADPVGRSIRIGNVSLQVIGVMAPKGGAALGGHDDMVLVPLNTYWTYLGKTLVRGSAGISLIDVQVADPAHVDQAAAEIGTVLRARHNRHGEDDFTVQRQDDVRSLWGQVVAVMTALLCSIAAISLVVGSIGIMNIMLVVVRERTREIGLRKAVGAKRRDVLWQFLAEALSLSVAGGALGLGLAWLLAQGAAVASAAYGSPIVPTLGWPAPLAAVVVSAGAGLSSGIYPAIRASRLSPSDALRFE